MPADKEATKEAVRRAATDGRLTCDKAHELGKELEISLREIGEICDELNVKIKACQLGCF